MLGSMAHEAGYVDVLVDSDNFDTHFDAHISSLLKRRVGDGHVIAAAAWTRGKSVAGTLTATGGSSLVAAMSESRLSRLAVLSRPLSSWRDEELARLSQDLLETNRCRQKLVHDGRPLSIISETTIGPEQADVVPDSPSTSDDDSAGPATPPKRRLSLPGIALSRRASTVGATLKRMLSFSRS